MHKYLLSLLLLATNTYAKTIKVLIIDTKVDVHSPFLKGSVRVDEPYSIGDYHGTAVASLILYGGFSKEGKPKGSLCGNVEVTSCDYDKYPGSYLSCLSKMSDYDYVNLSLQGDETNIIEDRLFKLTNKPLVVVAAGNYG